MKVKKGTIIYIYLQAEYLQGGAIMQKERQNKTLAMFSSPDYWLILAGFACHQSSMALSWLMTDRKRANCPLEEKESDRCRVVYMSPAAANCRGESLLFSSQAAEALLPDWLPMVQLRDRFALCTMCRLPRSQEGTRLKLGVISKWGMIPSPVIVLSFQLES